MALSLGEVPSVPTPSQTHTTGNKSYMRNVYPSGFGKAHAPGSSCIQGGLLLSNVCCSSLEEDGKGLESGL